ncbi:hypothetical protein PV05_07495 [Exophiala xenobiotica]|uniref:Uncharacterized protein n=1 Tax=Exophiala xenobiotica TaxID=348802 RepID=A0A0D2CYG6_9EURO|nr:uncharacterized protein PV05_07495 [Exophiala xenobiotica]KIW55192.1 hypothetical protein PV05_07495 [Exophiala xenobiotica]
MASVQHGYLLSFIHSNCSLSLPGSSPLLLFPTDPSHEHPRTQSQWRRRPTNQISSITKHKAASHGSMKNPPGTRFQGPPTKKPEITSALLISSDNHNQQHSKSSQTKGTGPPSKNVLKPKTNKEFSAWAEYMGEEKDEDFIKWKKNMVGDGQDSQKK